MQRVLQVFCEPFENGGQELYITNVYRHMNREEFQFDFIAQYEGKNDAKIEEIRGLGAEFFSVPIRHRKDSLFQRIIYFRSVRSLLKERSYTVVHLHSMSILGLLVGSFTCRLAGVPHILVHSHEDGIVTLRYRVIKFLSAPFLRHCPTEYLACSEKAAAFKFPAEIIAQKRFRIPKNGIEVPRFAFDAQARKKYRAALGADDRLVVGHIARFHPEKNHSFLLDVFAEFSKSRPDAVLWLIGEGELQDAMQEKAARLGLSDKVRFLGVRQDIPALLSAMDLMIFPSLYEGFGIVLLEAQASSLPVFAADSIQPEARVTDCIRVLPLSQSAEWWSREIAEACKHLPPRDGTATRQITDAGYDIDRVAESFAALYREKFEMQEE